MRNLLLLLFLSLVSSLPRAENYAQRNDVQAFVQEMHDRHDFDNNVLTALFRQAWSGGIVR